GGCGGGAGEGLRERWRDPATVPAADTHDQALGRWPRAGYGQSMSGGRTRVLAIVLAGGEGKRLMPLTADRAKPAVPFAGIYRLVDFALSNLVNAGYLKIVVLTQDKSHSLERHITKTWREFDLPRNHHNPLS